MIQTKGTVAHFTKLKHLKNILKNKKIKLSPVVNFDDPREKSLGWISTLGYGEGPDLDQWNIARSLKNKAGTQINILCTCDNEEKIAGYCPIESSHYGKPRIWSQYGDNFKGFCVIFNKENLENQLQKKIKQPKHIISDKVSYYESLHQVCSSVDIEYGSGINLENINIFDMLNYNRMMHSIYFKKSIDWKDECEFRWLVFSEKCEPIFISIEDCIEAVVLGVEFPYDKFEEAKRYCNILNIPCSVMSYDHPR